MHGNVAEWVMDEVTAEGYARQALLSELVPMKEAIQWPKQLESRAVRGGAFHDEPTECRSAARRKSRDLEWNDTDAESPKSPHWFMAIEGGIAATRKQGRLQQAAAATMISEASGTTRCVILVVGHSASSNRIGSPPLYPTGAL